LLWNAARYGAWRAAIRRLEHVAEQHEEPTAQEVNELNDRSRAFYDALDSLKDHVATGLSRRPTLSEILYP
jgi:hypothetical protein